ncbi:MAG: ABC transporter ATP-binding protein [Clostridiaceae bacterium]
MKILELNNVSKSIKKNKILKNISFSIDEGEIVGFVGPNGAGKTTTLKVITNLLYQDQGQVIIAGNDTSKNREQALANIGAIIENPGLYTFLTGRENLDFIRKLRKISKEKMEEIIKFTGLKERIDDKVEKYSLGMKQRLALGMSLITNPKLLLLDEPTNGLDPTGVEELREILKKLSKEENISVFISSHQLSEIEKICDRVIFIKAGEIINLDKNVLEIKGQTIKLKINIENQEELAKNIFKDCEFVNKIQFKDGYLIVNIKENKLSEFLKLLTNNDIEFSDLDIIKDSVENKYDQIFREN